MPLLTIFYSVGVSFPTCSVSKVENGCHPATGYVMYVCHYLSTNINSCIVAQGYPAAGYVMYVCHSLSTNINSCIVMQGYPV